MQKEKIYLSLWYFSYAGSPFIFGVIQKVKDRLLKIYQKHIKMSRGAPGGSACEAGPNSNCFCGQKGRFILTFRRI